MPFKLFSQLKTDGDRKPLTIMWTSILDKIGLHFSKKNMQTELVAPNNAIEPEQALFLMDLDEQINWIHHHSEIVQYEIFENDILETSSITEPPQIRKTKFHWFSHSKRNKVPMRDRETILFEKQFPRKDYEITKPKSDCQRNKPTQSTRKSSEVDKSILRKSHLSTEQSTSNNFPVTPVSSHSTSTLKYTLNSTQPSPVFSTYASNISRLSNLNNSSDSLHKDLVHTLDLARAKSKPKSRNNREREMCTNRNLKKELGERKSGHSSCFKVREYLTIVNVAPYT